MKYTKPGLVALCLTLTLTSAITFAVNAQSTAKKPAAKKVLTEVKHKAHCGMVYSAANAKKYHYVCPMDHKPLTKIAANAKSGKTAPAKQ